MAVAWVPCLLATGLACPLVPKASRGPWHGGRRCSLDPQSWGQDPTLAIGATQSLCCGWVDMPQRARQEPLSASMPGPVSR